MTGQVRRQRRHRQQLPRGRLGQVTRRRARLGDRRGGETRAAGDVARPGTMTASG